MKNIRNVLIGAVLLAFIGFTAYTLLPKPSDQPVEKKATLLEFKVVKNDLQQWEIDKYTNEFADLKNKLEANPDNFDNLMALGQIKKYVGDYPGAEAVWVRVGELRPFNSTSFGDLADLYVNFTKEYDKAEQAYQVAITNSLGEDKNVYFQRNFYYFYKDYIKDDQKAEQTLIKGIEANPKSGELHILLGIFYKDRGKTAQAIEQYEQGLALSPDNDAARQELNALKRQQ